MASPTPRTGWQAKALFGLMTFLWGLGFVVVKLGLNAAAPPFLAAGLRFLIAGLLGYGICLARRTPLPWSWQAAERYVLVGVLAYLLPFGLLYCGLKYVTTGPTAVVQAGNPLFAGILAHFLLGELLTRRKLAGILLALSGIVLLYADSLRAPTPHAALGIGLVLGSTVAHAVAAVYVRGRCRGQSPLSLNAVAMAVGGALFLLLAAGFERPWPPLTPLAWFTIVWLAVFSSVVCYGIYWWLLGRLEVSRASLTSFLIPLVTIVLGRLILHETMQPIAALATVIVLAGVGLAITAHGGQRGDPTVEAEPTS